MALIRIPQYTRPGVYGEPMDDRTYIRIKKIRKLLDVKYKYNRQEKKSK